MDEHSMGVITSTLKSIQTESKEHQTLYHKGVDQCLELVKDMLLGKWAAIRFYLNGGAKYCYAKICSCTNTYIEFRTVPSVDNYSPWKVPYADISQILIFDSPESILDNVDEKLMSDFVSCLTEME